MFAAAAVVLPWSPWAAAARAAGVPGRRTSIEHHPGVDIARFRPAERRARERPRVLFVGGRFAAKGGDVLLDALGPLAGRELDLDLVTQADVPSRGPACACTTLATGRPALIDLYQQADVFCLPTRGDAVPFSVIEAMAAGDAGRGDRHRRDPGPAGRRPLRPADRGGRSGARCCEAVAALLADAPGRAALAQAARERSEARYDAGTQTRRLAALLREAAGAA